MQDDLLARVKAVRGKMQSGAVPTEPSEQEDPVLARVRAVRQSMGQTAPSATPEPTTKLGKVKRWVGEAASEWKNPLDATMDLTGGAAVGLGRGVADLGAGLSSLAGYGAKLIPGQWDDKLAAKGVDAFHGLSDKIGEYTPDSKMGTIGSVGGYMGSIGAQVAAGGAGVAGLTGRLAGTMGQASRAGRALEAINAAMKAKGAAGFGARVGAGMAASAPVDIAQAADPRLALTTMAGELTGNESLKNANLAQRIAAEVLTGGVLGAGLEGVVSAKRAVQARRAAGAVDQDAALRQALGNQTDELAGMAPIGPAPTPGLIEVPEFAAPKPRSSDQAPFDLEPPPQALPPAPPRAAVEPDLEAAARLDQAATQAPFADEVAARLGAASMAGKLAQAPQTIQIPTTLTGTRVGLDRAPEGILEPSGAIPVPSSIGRTEVSAGTLSDIDPFEALARDPNVVNLPREGAGRGGSTATAMRVAMETRGRDVVKQLIDEELAKRGVRTETSTMAAAEEVARRLASETSGFKPLTQQVAAQATPEITPGARLLDKIGGRQAADDIAARMEADAAAMRKVVEAKQAELPAAPVASEAAEGLAPAVSTPVNTAKPRGRMAKMEQAGQGRLLVAGAPVAAGLPMTQSDDPEMQAAGAALMAAGAGAAVPKSVLKKGVGAIKRAVTPEPEVQAVDVRGAEGLPPSSVRTSKLVDLADQTKEARATGAKWIDKGMTPKVSEELVRADAAIRQGTDKLPELKTIHSTDNLEVKGTEDNLYKGTHEEKVSRAVERGVEEGKEALFGPAHVAKSAVWYRDAIVKMEKELVRLLPELKHPDKMAFFKILAAVTSPNNAPIPNIRQAVEIYSRFRFGHLPDGRKAGDLSALAGGVSRTKSSADIDLKLKDLQSRLNTFTKQAGGDQDKGLKLLINDMLNREVVILKGNKNQKSRVLRGIKEVLSKSNDARKTANFWLNLMGQSGFVTGDVWATRTLRRWLGYVRYNGKRVAVKQLNPLTGKMEQVVDPHTGKEVWTKDADKMDLDGIPANPEYNVLEDSFEQIAKRLNEDPAVKAKISEMTDGARDHLDPMDIQALLWYYEKDLYYRAGAENTGKDGFDDAARIIREEAEEGKRLGFADPKHPDLKLPEVKVGKKGERLHGSVVQREKQITRMMQDTPEEFERRAARIAKELGISKEKFSSLSKETKKRLLIDSKHGAVDPNVALSVAGAGSIAVGETMDEDSELGSALKVGGAAALGTGLVRGIKGRKGLTLEDAKAMKESEKDLAGPQLPASPYEESVLRQTIGTTKTDEPILTPGLLKQDPSGKAWALETAKMVPQRQSIPDEVVDEYAKYADLTGVLKGEKLATQSDEIRGLAQIYHFNKKRVLKVNDRLAEIGKLEQAGVKLDDAQKAEKAQLINDEGMAMKAIYAALEARNKGGSEIGRAMRLLRDIGHDTSDAAFWARQLKKRIGIPVNWELPPEVAKKFEEIMKTSKDGKLTKEMRDEMVLLWGKEGPTSSWTKRVLDFTKAGLLTNPATHVANMSGNVAKIFADQTVASPIAAMADRMLSAAFSAKNEYGVKPRAKTWSPEQLKAGLKGSSEYMGEMASSVIDAARQGKTIREKISKAAHAAHRELVSLEDENVFDLLDIQKVNYGDSPAGNLAKGYVDTVFGSLDKEDKLFRKGVIAAVLREQGELDAMNRGLKSGSPEFKAHVASFLSGEVSPQRLVEAIAVAELAARKSVFQEDNALATWIQKGKAQGGGLGNVLDLLMPFTRTPTNIVKQAAVDYTGLGLGSTLYKLGKQGLLKKGLTAENLKARREIVEKIGTTSVGLGLIAAGMFLFDRDELSGSRALTPEENSKNLMKGIGPNAVKVGENTRLNVSRFGTVGMLLSMGADIANALEQGNVGAAALSPLSVAGELPMLKGAAAVSEFAGQGARPGQDPTKGATRAIGTVLGRAVPSFWAAGVKGLSDESPRRKTGNSVFDQLKDRSGIGRGDLPATRNQFGKAEKARGLMLELFAPGVRKEITGPLEREAEKIGYTPSPLQKLSGETDAEYDKRVRRISPKVASSVMSLLKSSKYQAAPVSDKKKMFKARLSEARKAYATPSI